MLAVATVMVTRNEIVPSDSQIFFLQLPEQGGQVDCTLFAGYKKQLAEMKAIGDSILLIGPEGDFTPAEIDLALAAWI